MLEFSLARRLLLHSANSFARFVTWVSFIGLILGVMILTVVVSVMNGFDRELKERLLSTLPHVTMATLADPTDYAGAVEGSVKSVTRYFQGVGALQVGSRIQPVTVYGIDPNMQGVGAGLEGFGEAEIASLRRDPDGMLVGGPIFRALTRDGSGRVNLLTVDMASGNPRPTSLSFNLAGNFVLGAQPDYSLVIVNLAKFSLKKWQNYGEVGIQIQLKDPLRAAVVAEALAEKFPEVAVASWETTYGELFRAVKLEKSMMFMLLLLVVAIAAFNIIAGQTMLVEDKRRDIAILCTMGARASLIRNMFFLQGVLVGLFGTFLGLLFGLLSVANINSILAGVEALTGMHLLDGSFFIEVPVFVIPADLILIVVLSGLICLGASLAPALRAAKLDPVLGLH